MVLGAAVLFVQFLLGAPGDGEGRVAPVAAPVGLLIIAAIRRYVTPRESRRLARQVDRMTDQVYRQSRADPLTGPFNRRALSERFGGMVSS